jgi:hypothetical protein
VDLPTTAAGRATARVSICLNVAHVRAFDRSGKSIVAKTRKPFYLTRIDLIDHGYPTKAKWLVSHVSATEQQSCNV